ncbi:MAG: hypothetical protein PHV61_10470 [Limnochordia bacterium]|nr:hypothetical protein [Limnochordia bacterium]MDD4517986.1 hypothetical protein [Limnochordia bacterium]
MVLRLSSCRSVFYYPSNDGIATRTFLCELKAFGFYPDKIITDQMGSYENAIKEVFPETRHIYCLLHAERSARKAV